MEVIAGELPDPAPVTIATLPLTLYGCECSVSFFRPRCRAAMVMPSFSKAELVLMLQSINRGDNTVMMEGAKHNPSSHQPRTPRYIHCTADLFHIHLVTTRV
jgi:hypothetical protein